MMKNKMLVYSYTKIIEKVSPEVKEPGFAVEKLGEEKTKKNPFCAAWKAIGKKSDCPTSCVAFTHCTQPLGACLLYFLYCFLYGERGMEIMCFQGLLYRYTKIMNRIHFVNCQVLWTQALSPLLRAEEEWEHCCLTSVLPFMVSG